MLGLFAASAERIDSPALAVMCGRCSLCGERDDGASALLPGPPAGAPAPGEAGDGWKPQTVPCGESSDPSSVGQCLGAAGLLPAPSGAR